MRLPGRSAKRCAAARKGVSRAIVLNLCGHGHFDMSAYTAYLAGNLMDYEYPEQEIAMALAGLPSVAGQ
jgi:tryptophan synthase beta chain